MICEVFGRLEGAGEANALRTFVIFTNPKESQEQTTTMSVQNISAQSDPTISQDYTNAHAAWAKFNQMGEALQSGDLAQAQADYSYLMQNAPASVRNGNGPVSQALAKLGSALQSGSVSSAQQAFQVVAQHLIHRHHTASQGAASSDATAGSTSGASGTSSGSILDVQA